jgi:hypothetical protein
MVCRGEGKKGEEGRERKEGIVRLWDGDALGGGKGGEIKRKEKDTHGIFDDCVVILHFLPIHRFEEGPSARMVHDVREGLL